jgi:hypothetical protein
LSGHSPTRREQSGIHERLRRYRERNCTWSACRHAASR